VYVPSHFAEDDWVVLLDTIEAYPFGLLVLSCPHGLEAAHLPFVVKRSGEDKGLLRCHVARANPIWKGVHNDSTALAVFSGPHSYISPDWYDSKHQVPTWNYVAVHVTGIPRLMEDWEVIDVLDDLSEISESRLAKSPWTAGRLPQQVYKGLRKGIVGIEIGIESMQGKWKLSQNKTPADRRRAALALDALRDENSHGIADLMRVIDQNVTDAK